ncbi:MAG: hypothetical protein ACYDD5_01050 [Sulfuricurvum sp.]
MKQEQLSNFIQKANITHSNAYSYTKSEYTNSTTKLSILCPTHGDFLQTPGEHVRGKGCPECGKIKARNKRTSTTEKFIEKAKTKHNHYYTYEKTTYAHNEEKTTITCPIHGDFIQTPMHHLQGNGCPQCGKDKVKNLWVSNSKTFQKKAEVVHNNKYTYKYVDYQRNNLKVLITCPTHGNFQQRPNAHLTGQGCPKCVDTSLYNNMWSYSMWEKAGTASKNFKGFTLYILECLGKDEKFYKVGKTFTDIKKRYTKSNMPYSMSVVFTKTGSANDISKLEHTVLKEHKQDKYKPLIHFPGASECLLNFPNF